MNNISHIVTDIHLEHLDNKSVKQFFDAIGKKEKLPNFASSVGSVSIISGDEVLSNFESTLYKLQISEIKERAGDGLKASDEGKDINSYSIEELISLVKENNSTYNGIFPSSISTHKCETKETCPDCGGSRICPTCEGKKRVSCPNCGGNGRCPTCDAEGHVKCPDCGGGGRVTCECCNGSKLEDCTVCNGFGWLTCDDCDGTGRYTLRNGTTVTCRKCNGEGQITCYQCQGRGTFYCKNCRGTGRVDCDTCDGDGWVTCPDCEGTKVCHTCDGSGKVTCYNCDGSGKCPECDKDGKITCRRCNGTGKYQKYQEFSLNITTKNFIVSHPLNFENLHLATGEILFNGDIYKKERETLLKDERTKAFKTIPERSRSFIEEQFKKILNYSKSEGIIGVNEAANIKSMPMYDIHYTIKGNHKSYDFYIIGKNGVIFYDKDERPSRVASLFRGFLRKSDAFE